MNNSQLPVDHVLAGSFESAMRVSTLVILCGSVLLINQKQQIIGEFCNNQILRLHYRFINTYQIIQEPCACISIM